MFIRRSALACACAVMTLVAGADLLRIAIIVLFPALALWLPHALQ